MILTETVQLAKNRVTKTYFDKVLNEDMKAFLCAAILYAFGDSFSSYWNNFIYSTPEDDLVPIFKDYAKENKLVGMEAVLSHVEKNLSPEQRMRYLDISSVAKSILFFRKRAKEDPRTRENFDAFCQFFSVSDTDSLFDKLNNILMNRNRTAGHPSDTNILEHCTADKFVRCIRSCAKAIELITAAGKTTERLEETRQQCFKDFEKLQKRAECVPYSLYDTAALSGYTLGTVNAFLNDESFGQQIAHTRDKGSVIFLDVPPAEVKRRLDSYVRAQAVPAPVKPKPAAPAPTQPTQRKPSGCRKWLLLVPLALFLVIFLSVAGMFTSISSLIKEQMKQFNGDQQGGTPWGDVSGDGADENTLSLPNTPTPTGPHISGKVGLHDTLYLSVDQVQSETVTLIFENYSIYSCTLGWANTAPCYAVTDKGTYVGTMPKRGTYRIAAASRDSVAVVFEGLEGTIQSITMEQVYLLGSDGLPLENGGETMTVMIEAKE